MKNWTSIVLAAALAAGMASGQTPAAATRVTLYDRLGGMPAIRAVVDELATRNLADERINRWFAHAASDPANLEAYKSKLADFVCQGTGGPCKYTGADMIAAHKGRGVTEEAFQAVVEDLVAALNKLKVPEKEKSDLPALLALMRPAIVQ